MWSIWVVAAVIFSTLVLAEHFQADRVVEETAATSKGYSGDGENLPPWYMPETVGEPFFLIGTRTNRNNVMVKTPEMGDYEEALAELFEGARKCP